ncbi:MAG TPA: hypothetical protein VG205_12160 [Acidimicrobiales bacterium]|nr:hypothetical protein [Acidimicrobiales bacterium]
MTTFTVASSQCDGPTYLSVLNPGLDAVYGELSALLGLRPGAGLYPPSLSSCSPLPTALSALVGTASSSSVASPNGSATVSVQSLGNQLVEESAEVNTKLTGSLTLSSPASSVNFTIPYTTAPFTTSGTTPSGDTANAAVIFDGTTGLNTCVDGSTGIWSTPPGQYDLEAPMGAGSGTASVRLFCPDGSDLGPGAVGLDVSLLANAYSGDSVEATASANIQMQGVTATINS